MINEAYPGQELFKQDRKFDKTLIRGEKHTISVGVGRHLPNNVSNMTHAVESAGIRCLSCCGQNEGFLALVAKA